MSIQVQRRGGTTAEHATFTGAAREITVDTTKKVVVVHDGVTAGGMPMARAGGTNTFTGDQTLANNLIFSGSGARITGDFSNATVASRVMFQTSTANGTTNLSVVPNGTQTTSVLRTYGASDPTNAVSFALATVANSEARLVSEINGSATYVPMTFYTGGAERMRIATDGTTTLGGTSTQPTLKIQNNNTRWVTIDGSATNPTIGTSAGSLEIGSSLTMLQTNLGSFAGGEWCRNASWGTYYKAPASGSAADIAFVSAGDETRLVVASTGVYNLKPTGIGYGIGAGGTVTQATSRTTGVTLNTPTGKITMFTAAGSATWQQFTVTNSLVATTDNIVLTMEGGNSNIYLLTVVGIAAGSFIIGFATTGGTTSDTPRINFAIIKGANS